MMKFLGDTIPLLLTCFPLTGGDWIGLIAASCPSNLPFLLRRGYSKASWGYHTPAPTCFPLAGGIIRLLGATIPLLQPAFPWQGVH